MVKNPLAVLFHHYRELSELCYRVAISRHDELGRFKRGHRGRRPHPALAKKIDLDHELQRLIARFFGNRKELPA